MTKHKFEATVPNFVVVPKVSMVQTIRGVLNDKMDSKCSKDADKWNSYKITLLAGKNCSPKRLRYMRYVLFGDSSSEKTCDRYFSNFRFNVLKTFSF